MKYYRIYDIKESYVTYIYKVHDNGVMYYWMGGQWILHSGKYWNQVKDRYAWSKRKEISEKEVFIEIL